MKFSFRNLDDTICFWFLINIIWIFSLCFTGDVSANSTLLCNHKIQRNQTCVSCVNNPLIIQCPVGHVITGFVHAGFGSNIINHCEPEEDDCIAEPVILMSRIYNCVWRVRECYFTLSIVDIPKSICLPGSQAKYLKATDLNCIMENNLHSMCMPSTSKILTVSHSAGSKALHYIISPNFQLPYTQNINFRKTDCWMNITAPRGVGIRLVSQYMDIRPDKSHDNVVNKNQCTMDYIEVTWQSTIGVVLMGRYCGRDDININIENNEVTVKFVINSEDEHTYQGFVLRYEGFPLAESKAAVEDIEAPSVQANNCLLQDNSIKSATNTTPSTTYQHETKIHTMSTLVIVIIFITLVIILALTMAAVCMVCTFIRSQYIPGSREHPQGEYSREHDTVKFIAAVAYVEGEDNNYNTKRTVIQDMHHI